MRLHNKIILITGSITGIGAAIATRFVAEGAKVILHGLDPAPGQALLSKLGHANARLITADLAHSAAPKQLIEFTLAQFGALHGLVNNAAYIPRTNLSTTTEPIFDQCLTVNVRAPLFLIQHAMPHLIATKGSILNIGSVNAYTGEPNLLPYSISKGALMVLTRNLADAHASSGVRINQINLGWVLSDSEDRVQQSLGKPPGWSTSLPKAFAPIGRIIQPEEVASNALYWMSDESQAINGTVMELAQFPIIGRNPAKEDF